MSSISASKNLFLMYVQRLAEGLVYNNGIMFRLPSVRSNHNNQMKMKDTGCSAMCVHIGSERTSNTLKVLFVIGSCCDRI